MNNTTTHRVLQGTVVSVKTAMTCIVRVDRTVEHAKYQKRYKVSKRYAVHDPMGKAKEGMLVRIQECRPVSKTKKWELVKVIESGK